MLFCGIWLYWPFPPWRSTRLMAFCHNSLSTLFLPLPLFFLSLPHGFHFVLQLTRPWVDSFPSRALTHKCWWLPNLSGQHVCFLSSRPGYLIACSYLAPQSLSVCPKLVLLPSYSPSVLFIFLMTYSLSLYSLSLQITPKIYLLTQARKLSHAFP